MQPRDFARKLRTTLTDVERIIWNELRSHRFAGLKFKRQQPIGDYVVDFVCFEKRLVIELDGGQHAERDDYDSARDRWLVAQGFSVLRFWNNDVMNNRSGVLEAVAMACGVLDMGAPSPLPLSRKGRGASSLPSPLAGEGPGERGISINHAPTKQQEPNP